ncbi:MAG TPA: divalent-cation tolerance protein CutA [Candidatus Dormibacteraeota bacterium]|nr:divalent-cation tolerance protein CutA [Candidatus Dormibacteraeota bacterium]
MTDKRIVLSTAGSEDEARRIARHLVELQLAACVNIVPQIESVYHWQGRVESNREWLLLIKTTAEKFPGVCSAIRELHSYELPECISITVDDGSPQYLQWISDAVR